jgi:multicomponent K+:H+ antiporter subunit G
MSAAVDLSPWIVWPVAVLLVFGASLTLVGAVAPLRLTRGGTLGGGASILLASMIYFTATSGRPDVREILLLGFVLLTPPITLLVIVRAALHADRVEGHSPVLDSSSMRSRRLSPSGMRSVRPGS